MTFLQHTFLGNSVEHWAVALAVTLGVTGALRLIRTIVVSRFGKLAERSANKIDDALIHALKCTYFLVLLAVGVWAGSHYVTLSANVHRLLSRFIMVLLVFQVATWATATAVEWLRLYRERSLESDRGAATSVGALTFIARVAIWSICLLIALDNIGVNITAMITGLGISGIAVALALQNVLGDLIASLSIVLDKPFVIGDFLIIDEHLGAVENVGLRTTRIRSLSGEQLVFSNTDLIKSRIRNYGRMFERRVVFTIGVVYGTDAEKLKKIPGMIRAAIESQDKTRFDRSHFAKYGDFSLNFETVYYVLAPDYNLYMDIQQAVNLRLYEEFAQEGIEFAFPTQTLFVKRDVPDEVSP